MNDSLNSKEYLERYLSFIMPENKASDVSEALLRSYGSLPLIASTANEVLAETVGVSLDTALMIKLLGYVYSRSIKDDFVFGKAYSEDEIKKYLIALFTGSHVEMVYCISLDAKGCIIALDCLNVGIVNASEISARIVVECACRHGAASVILAHNHPKGSINASGQDVSSTFVIKNVLSVAGIELAAHYLVSETECMSISEQMSMAAKSGSN